MNHLVSVIIPTYNRASTIKQSIDSVLNQTYSNIEIIIVDDASTDNTSTLMDEWYGDIDNIIYIINDCNLGPAASRNVGVSYASGEYIAFHDSDDVWLPDKLSIQMNYLSSQTDCEIVYTPYIHQQIDGVTTTVPLEANFSILENTKNIFPYLLECPLISPITLVMKKSIFVNLGGYNENLYSFEDYEFSLRLAKYNKVGFVKEPLAIAYQSENGVDSRFPQKLITYFYILENFSDDFLKYNLLENTLATLLQVSYKSNYFNIFMECAQKLTNTDVIFALNRLLKDIKF